jgi:hypothetical protein
MKNGETQGTASPEVMNKVNNIPAIPMLSDLGKKLASVTAPSSAYEVRTTSTPAVKEK